MTDQEINMAIAEHLGWTGVRVIEPHPRRKADGPTIAGTPPATSQDRGVIVPDYCNDLNACAEFERTLTDMEQMDDYLVRLANIVRSQLPPEPPVSSIGIVFARVTAKPHQRAEAFLCVVGKWKEAR